jgi:hypothetical protein
MSIIYEALKKVEGKVSLASLENTPRPESPPLRKKERKIIVPKKRTFLSPLLFLIALGLLILSFLLPDQQEAARQKALSRPAEKREIDPVRVHVKPEVTEKYVLEGIVYDSQDSFAIINGKAVKESDTIGDLRMDKISEDSVELVNNQDNSRVTLLLPY